MRKTIRRSLMVGCLFLIGLTAYAQRTSFYDKGYAGNVELGFLIKEYPYASLSTTHGFCFGKGWFIGLGGAFESGLYPRKVENEAAIPDSWYGEGFRQTKNPYEGDMMVKFYLDFRKSFHLKNTTVFADIKFGTPFNLANPFGFGDFVRPSVGMVFGRHWAASIGADWSSYPYPDKGTDVVKPKQITLPYIGLAYIF